MKKAGGNQFTGSYIMYGLVVVALILLTLFILRGSMTERFFAAATADPIQTRFDTINTELDKVKEIPTPNTICTGTIKNMLEQNKAAIIQYNVDSKKKFNEYANKFNDLIRIVRDNCNRSIPIDVQTITPLPDDV